MPEGHTLHRLALDHADRFTGARVLVASPQGRFAREAARLTGQTFRGAEAWGKHLFHYYGSGGDGSDGDTVHIHLGLYGSFRPVLLPEGGAGPTARELLDAPVEGQVRMRLVGRGSGVDLRGPNRCELIGPAQVDAILARLGPDPLRVAGAGARTASDAIYRRIAASATPIGVLLMDQRVIAGVGNVYRAEVLFRGGIHPMRPGRAVTREEWGGVFADLLALMPIGVATGFMHVVRPEHDVGAPSYAPNRPRTYVYRRTGEPCRVCGTPISGGELAARKIYFCPACQPTG